MCRNFRNGLKTFLSSQSPFIASRLQRFSVKISRGVGWDDDFCRNRAILGVGPLTAYYTVQAAIANR